MPNDSIKCPLCNGLSTVSRTALIQKLKDPELLAKVETLVTQLESAAGERGPVASDFQAQVHSWNPANPMWKRSPKE